MRPKMLLLCLALVLALPESVRADEGYTRTGVYFGFHSMYMGELFESEIEDSLPGVDLEVDDSKGFNARFGYRLFPWLALELQGDYYDDYNIELLGVDAAELGGWSASLIGKFYPFTGRIQPYLLGGGGYMQVDLSDQLGLGLSEDSSGSVAQGGLGVDIYLTRHIVLNLESSYAYPMGGVADLDFWTVRGGLEYRF